MKTSFVVLLAALCALSCRRGDLTPTAPSSTREKIADYFPLTNGSYWVYQGFDSDTSLVFTPSNLSDSLAVEKDTIVGGVLYKKIASSLLGRILIRDSSGYLVNELGEKLFTVNHAAGPLLRRFDLYPDTSVVNTAMMMTSDSVSLVPAGQFAARYVLGMLTSSGQATLWSGQRQYFRSYSKGVGMICRRGVWIISGTYLELRLMRYKIIPG